MKLLQIIITTSFLLFHLSLTAQKDSLNIETADAYTPSKIELKFSPLSILPFPTSSLQFALEHKLKNPQNALQHEIGYLRPFPHNIINTQYKNMNGIRLQSGYRYYVREPQRTFNFFVGGRYIFQYEQWSLNGWFDRFDEAYQEFYNYNKQITSNGIQIIAGSNRKAKKSRFTLGFELGFGAKIRTIYNQGVPSDASNDDFVSVLGEQFEASSPETAGSKIYPTMSFSLKLGAVLK